MRIAFDAIEGEKVISVSRRQRRRPPPPPPARAPPPPLRAPALLGDGRLAPLDIELRLEAPRELAMLVWRPES
ncbi:MAG: hypothetical protein U5L05_11580 [Rubrivivax sp.]|nr:hypothetical protein [Rubrivivax sp.]